LPEQLGEHPADRSAAADHDAPFQHVAAAPGDIHRRLAAGTRSISEHPGISSAALRNRRGQGLASTKSPRRHKLMGSSWKCTYTGSADSNHEKRGTAFQSPIFLFVCLEV
jgi:hypothetical protein